MIQTVAIIEVRDDYGYHNQGIMQETGEIMLRFGGIVLHRTIIPRFTSKLIPKEKENVIRMTTQIEVRGTKKLDDVNRNKVNRGYVNRWIALMHLFVREYLGYN